MRIRTIDSGLVHLERDEKTYLGIAVGKPGRTFGLRKLTEASGPRGWIVSGNEISAWDTHGIVEHEDNVYLYGAFCDPTPLSVIIALPVDEALGCIERLAHALDVLTRADRCPKRIHTRGVLFLQSGEILFLGDRVIDSIADMSDESTRIEEMERLNYPDYDGPGNGSFAVSVLLYRVLCGQWPYKAETEEDIHTHIREAHALGPELYRPDLDLTVAKSVFAAVRNQGTKTFEDWSREIHDWRDSGYTRTIDEKEREELQKRATSARITMDKSLGRREMVRKHWKQVVVITLGIIIAGSIPMSMLRNHLAPRRTAGMAPQEVVEAFLFGQNELDHDLMDDAVIDGAGRQYIREVTNLFVVSRMRMSVEMDSGIIDPVNWTADGRPALEPGRWVYGVVNPEFEQLSGSSNETVFRVRYERWSPDQDTHGDPEEIDLETPMGFIGVRREDIFRLRLDGSDWVIFELETVSRERIEDW